MLEDDSITVSVCILATVNNSEPPGRTLSIDSLATCSELQMLVLPRAVKVHLAERRIVGTAGGDHQNDELAIARPGRNVRVMRNRTFRML